MTGVVQRFGRVYFLTICCAAIACLGTGVLAGVDPQYALLLALGVPFTAVVFTNLSLGYALFTAVAFLDLLSSSGSFSGTKVVGLILFASWLSYLTMRHHPDDRSFVREVPGLVVALVAMLAWAALSFAWAESPGTALGGASRYLLDMLLIPIGFTAMRERRHATWVIAAFVIGATVSCVYGLATTSASGGFGGRLTGSTGDPNAEAAVFVAAIPLAISLIGSGRLSSAWRATTIIAVILLFLGLLSTVSREGLIAMAAVMIAAVVIGGRWRRKAVVLLLAGIAAGCGYFFVIAPLSSLQRITSSDTSGRATIWTIAWRVIKDHPVLGVGTDNFILVEGKYVNQPGAVIAFYVVNSPKVAHDMYLEALVDLGIPGLLTMIAVLGYCLGAAIRAAWIFERLGDRQMELMSRAVVWSLVGVLTADFFVSNEYARTLWILLAMCPALLALARRGLERSLVDAQANAGRRRARPGYRPEQPGRVHAPVAPQIVGH